MVRETGPNRYWQSSLELQGEFLFMFSNHVGMKDSNKGEVLAILEALRLYLGTSIIHRRMNCGK